MRASNVVYDRAHSSISTATPDQFDFDEIFKDADWFHFTGITPAVSDAAIELTEAALKAAKAHGAVSYTHLDPGGKVLPLTMAVFMFIGFLYLTVKERPEKTEVNPETRRLFLLTLILSVAYIFLIRPVGFVITSTVLVFWLEYICLLYTSRCV